MSVEIGSAAFVTVRHQDALKSTGQSRLEERHQVELFQALAGCPHPLEAFCCAMIVAAGVPALSDSSAITRSRLRTTSSYARNQAATKSAISSGTRPYSLSVLMNRW